MLTRSESRKRACLQDPASGFGSVVSSSKRLKIERTDSIPRALLPDASTPTGGARWKVAAAVGIRPRTRPSMPTSDHLYRCEESVGGCEVTTAPGSPASSYASTLACWSTQTDYNSDCTRRLSQESPTRAVSTSSTLSSPVSDTNTQSSDRTLTQSLPVSPVLLPELPSDEWKPVSWPTYVNPLGSHDNPRDYKFSVVP
ncbi:unnamed protein product [Phytophthora fragariaefolia]|uniref:Unnamed protein product n=1 Tax=Phytophthora fragariaefolia TaxID=1490495 RepID=A0A9W6Y506_9STRA|nr:unnamed protein product [Phytophthora fragariaefolia]